ncbi:hypothetical protein V8G54_000856 [Vigna mungo]|uniref:Uncharacterized protein n=1 Tax=Vigna mungo TaxID=3915 RepID=A0AAQ3P7U7_VIGMU
MEKKKKKKKKKKKVGYRGWREKRTQYKVVIALKALIQNKTENAKRESVKNNAIRHSSTIAVPWIRDYDRLQSFAVILIYLQIGCALVGSLGASYNGVSLVNLVVALFALVAIESSSQSLGRTYAFLLFCTILLDVYQKVESWPMILAP